MALSWSESTTSKIVGIEIEAVAARIAFHLQLDGGQVGGQRFESVTVAMEYVVTRPGRSQSICPCPETL